MTYGFRVYGPGGEVKLDVSDRLSRVIYWDGASSGSAYLPAFSSANGCYGFINRGGGIAPQVSVSFNDTTKTLQWSSNIPGAVFALAVR